MNHTAVGYVCMAAVFIFIVKSCGTRIDPAETKAVAEACASLGKEPEIVARPGEGFRLGCKDQPASANSR